MDRIRIIISPAKKMKTDADTVPGETAQQLTAPVFIDKADRLREWIRTLSPEEARRMWSCNERIARLNYERFSEMDLYHAQTPALLAFEGIQYQYMAPAVFEDACWEYVKDRLRILSGFYGVLRPLDAVVPYRLEMQAKLRPGRAGRGVAGRSDTAISSRGPGSGPEEIPETLYAYWNREIYREVAGEADCIVNLASKEYGRCIERYLEPDKRMITCVFGERKGAGIVQKGTLAKMARGEMVRYMAQESIADVEELKAFDRLGYRFEPACSDADVFCFLKEKEAMSESS